MLKTFQVLAAIAFLALASGSALPAASSAAGSSAAAKGTAAATGSATSAAEAMAPKVAAAQEEEFEVGDFVIVDCLLPGRTRRMGNSRIKGPRRPVRTSARDCNIRGGEYTSYDRADCRSSLEFWQQASGETKSGEAAFYVGQLLERGCEGLTPDPAKAVSWYELSVERDYRSARMSLAALYEQGRGVEKNPEKAMALLSGDLPKDVVLVDTQELATLQETLQLTRTEAADLGQQLEAARQEAQTAQSQAAASQADRSALEGSVKRLESQLAAASAKQAAAQLQFEALETRLAEAPRPDPALDYGKYHALVIGNQDYKHLPSVPKAKAYAEEVATLLERQYGFSVQRLTNATYEAIYRKLESLRSELTEEDNLLIYYVGSSSREPGRSYWHPVDAEDEDSKFNWLEVERHLSKVIDVIQAKQLLVVADAAFDGVRVRSAVPQLPTGMTKKQQRQRVKELLAQPSRMVMASGEGPSGFSPALVGCLKDNAAVTGASTIYGCVVKEMTASAKASAPTRYAPIRWGRSDGRGDFFFVPSR